MTLGLTWRAQPPSDEQAFKAMKAAIASGCNFWNAGEFYGTPEHNSLHLLEKYFTKYPEDADKVVLSVKGGLKNMVPDGTPEGVRASMDNCIKLLNGKKKLDIFEMARVDKNVPLETTLKTLEEEYVKTGKLGGIALSEVSGATIKKAAAITKIVAVEVELSLFYTDILTNGIAAACGEHAIPIVAYSPLCRGFLTGQIKKFEDLPEGDFRRHMPRFQPGNFETNLDIAKEVYKLADKKGCTPSQIAIGWVLSQSKNVSSPWSL